MTNKKAKEIAMKEARGIAARIWCEPQHKNKEMDVEFAESIAKALSQARKEAFEEAIEIASKQTVDFLDESNNSWVLDGHETKKRIANQIREKINEPK